MFALKRLELKRESITRFSSSVFKTPTLLDKSCFYRFVTTNLPPNATIFCEYCSSEGDD